MKVTAAFRELLEDLAHHPRNLSNVGTAAEVEEIDQQVEALITEVESGRVPVIELPTFFTVARKRVARR